MEGIDFHLDGEKKKKEEKKGRLVLEGRVSIKSFLLGLSVLLVIAVVGGGASLYAAGAVCVHAAAANALLLLAYGGPRRAPLYQVAVRACFLGAAFGVGLALGLSGTSWARPGWYVCSLSFFHYSEYLATAAANPRSLSKDSFLLNHSAQYGLAAALSWLEFAAWRLVAVAPLGGGLWPGRLSAAAGLAMALGGDALRKAAMLTAGANFNHVVQSRRARGHVLVTRGVYAYARHPAYAGWLQWSVGTQLLLGNPACTLGYALAGWRYFRRRVEEEEAALGRFFGEEYAEYKRRVPTGLPFISGVRVGEEDPRNKTLISPWTARLKT